MRKRAKECHPKAPWHFLDNLSVGLGGIRCKECTGEVDDHFLLTFLASLIDTHLQKEHGYKVCNRCGAYHKPGKMLFNLMGEWVCLKCSPGAVWDAIGEDAEPETIPGAERQIVTWIVRKHSDYLPNKEKVPEEIETIKSMFEPKRLMELYRMVVR